VCNKLAPLFAHAVLNAGALDVVLVAMEGYVGSVAVQAQGYRALRNPAQLALAEADTLDARSCERWVAQGRGGASRGCAARDYLHRGSSTNNGLSVPKKLANKGGCRAAAAKAKTAFPNSKLQERDGGLRTSSR
jgi:hypothetical protein